MLLLVNQEHKKLEVQVTVYIIPHKAVIRPSTPGPQPGPLLRPTAKDKGNRFQIRASYKSSMVFPVFFLISLDIELPSDSAAFINRAPASSENNENLRDRSTSG